MPAATLVIELDRPDRRYSLGERVSGTVEVRAQADCHCRGLRVASLWRAHRRWHSTDGPSEEQSLFEGAWAAGQSYRYPFELELPKGPLSYKGKEMSVDWLIAARADLPSAIDLRSEETLVVEGATDPSRVELPTVARREQVDRLALVKGVAKSVGGLILGGIGLAVLLLGLQGVRAGQGAAWLGVVTGAAFALPGLGLLVKGIMSLLGASLVRSVDVETDPHCCRPGESLGVGFRLLPRRAFFLTGISATLRGREVAVVGGGKSRHRYEHTFHQERQPIGAAQAARADVPVVGAGSFTVPEGAPHSFKHSGFHAYWEIEWSVRLEAHIRWFPDWVREYPVLVGP